MSVDRRRAKTQSFNDGKYRLETSRFPLRTPTPLSKHGWPMQGLAGFFASVSFSECFP